MRFCSNLQQVGGLQKDTEKNTLKVLLRTFYGYSTPWRKTVRWTVFNTALKARIMIQLQ